MAEQVQVRLPGQPLNGQRDLSRFTDEELELQRYLSALAQGQQLTAAQLTLQRRLNAIAAGERPALPAAPVVEGSGENSGGTADAAGRDDVSVVGVGELGAAMLHPPLTTFRVFPERLGEHLAEMVLGRITQPNLPMRQLAIPTEIVKRASCNRPGRRPDLP